MRFVLDASVALLWLVPQTNPAGEEYASAALKALKESQAVVPSLFALEAANVVAKVESKGVVTEADSQRFVALIGRLNLVTDQATALDLQFTSFQSLNGVLDAGEDTNANGLLDPGEDLPDQFDFNVGTSGAGGAPVLLSGNNFIGSQVTATFSSTPLPLQVRLGTDQACRKGFFRTIVCTRSAPTETAMASTPTSCSTRST